MVIMTSMRQIEVVSSYLLATFEGFSAEMMAREVWILPEGSSSPVRCSSSQVTFLGSWSRTLDAQHRAKTTSIDGDGLHVQDEWLLI